MFYFVNLFILLMYSLIFKYFGVSRKTYLIISAIHIGGILAFRSCYTGTDTYQYYNLYNRLISFRGDFRSLFQMFEKFPVWAFFFKAVSWVFGENPNAYMLVTGYFTVIITWAAIALLDIEPMQAVILYYLMFSLQAMNVARQNMAVCLVFLSAALLLKGRKKESLVLLPFAIGFHSSAIIGFFIWIILDINWTPKRVYIVMAVSIAALGSVNILFSRFAGSLAGYSLYFLGVHKASGRNVVLQISYLLSFVYAIWIIRKYELELEERQHLLKSCVLIWGEILLAIFFSTEIFIIRGNLYLQIFIIYLIPMVERYCNKYRKFYKLTVFGMALFYFSYRITGNYGGIMPYQTYLF